MSEILFINEDTVKSLLTWDATFEAVEASMASVAKKRAVQKARAFTKWSSSGSALLTMPGFLDHNEFGALGCKLVTMCPNNVYLEKPLPTIQAHIALFDENTGVLQAVMGGNAITKWRTAAASVVATKYLIPSKNPEILAILGAGEQGHIHAIAFQHFFNFKEIRVWNRNKAKADTLIADLNRSYPDQIFKCFESNEACIKDADVIVTATFAGEPIVQLEWVKENVHINAVGAGINHHSELSTSIYLNSNVYIDYVEGAEAELAGLKTLGVEFSGEIGSLISGELSPPPGQRITVFQSLGMAVEDCAMARLVYDSFKQRKIQ